MSKKMYSVFDKKAQVYGTPFFTQNEALALRSFQRAANDSTIDLGLFPNDFTLVELGDFDEDTGKISVMPHNRPICSASELVNKEK